MARILVVEDETTLRKNMVDRLRAESLDVYDAGSAESGIQLANLLAPDLILTDLRLPGMDGMELLRRVKASAPRSLVVIITAAGTRQSAVEAVREGAYDYLNKPVELKELVLLVNRAVSHSRALDRLNHARIAEQRLGSLEQIVGVSESIRELKNRTRQLCESRLLAGANPPLLIIEGETGSGKTLLAHTLHNEGPRRDGPCLTLNCAMLGAAEIEHEIFGGFALTGGAAGQKGVLGLAEGGTVILEEIAALAKTTQARLLDVIETRRVQEPGGAGRGLKIDAQIIATNSRNILSAIRRGDFLPELYNRISRISLHLDPLRNRKDDLVPLAELFLATHCRRVGVNAPRLTEDAISAMNNYDWPGNVRELSLAIERAVLACESGAIRDRDLGLPENHGMIGIEVTPRCDLTLQIRGKDSFPALRDIIAAVVRRVVENAGGDITQAAALMDAPEEQIRSLLSRDLYHESI